MHILNYLFVILWPLTNITVALALLITMRWKHFSINTLPCTIAIFHQCICPYVLGDRLQGRLARRNHLRQQPPPCGKLLW